MEKDTEKTLELAVKKLIGVLENTADFALEHAPDILKEMVVEAKVEAAFTISISSAILAICAVLMYTFIPKAIEGNYCNIGAGFTSGASGLAAVGCVIFISCSLYTLVLIKKCPKLFLLRKLKELASPSSEE